MKDTSAPSLPAKEIQLKAIQESKRATSLMATAKAAAELAAKQVERVKLTSSAIPQLYTALGKHCFSTNRYREEFPDLFEQLKAIQNELAQTAIHRHAKDNTFVEKAKATAGNAVQTANAAKLSMQQSSLWRNLGKVIHERYGNTAELEHLVEPITLALSRLTTLDGDIATLSTIGQGTWITPMRLMICITIVVGMAVFFMGGYAIKRNDVSQRMAKADTLWKSGNKSEAIADYRRIDLEDDWAYINGSMKSLIFNRIVEFQIDEGHDNEAKGWIKKALRQWVTLSPTSEKETNLIAMVKSEESQQRTSTPITSTPTTSTNDHERNQKANASNAMPELSVASTAQYLVKTLGTDEEQTVEMLEKWQHTFDMTDVQVSVLANGIRDCGQRSKMKPDRILETVENLRQMVKNDPEFNVFKVKNMMNILFSGASKDR